MTHNSKSNTTTTYDALIGSGEFGLISSRELRTLLARLKRQIGLLANYEEIQINFVDNQLTPLLGQYIDALSVQELGSDKTYDSYAIPPIQLAHKFVNKRFTSNYQQLLGDRAFANQLVELYRHTRVLTGIYLRIEGLISDIESILVAENPELRKE